MEEVTTKDSNVLSFENWHHNRGGERTMVQKLQDLHGEDYDISSTELGDDVVRFTRRSDNVTQDIRLDTDWTPNSNSSSGYKQYVDFVAPEQDADKILTNYYNKTVNEYKNKINGKIIESDNAFFERTKPITKVHNRKSTRNPNLLRKTYTEINGVIRNELGGYTYSPRRSDKMTTKGMRNVSEADKVMFEKISFLHDIKTKADDLRSKGATLSKKAKTKDDILVVSQVAGGQFDKKLVEDVETESDFKISDYVKWQDNERIEEAGEKILDIYTKTKVKHEEELESAIKTFMPQAEQEMQNHFEPRVSKLEEYTQNKYTELEKYRDEKLNQLIQERQNIVNSVGPGIANQIRQEVNQGLHKGKSQEELQKLYQSRLSKSLKNVEDKYKNLQQEVKTKVDTFEKEMDGKYNILNKDRKKYLNGLIKKAQNDPENKIGEVLEKISTESFNTWKNIEQQWLQSWKPTPDLIAENEYEKINTVLEKGGFANMSVHDKNRALQKQWSMLEDNFAKVGLSEEDIDARKHEFWGIYYNALDKDKDGSFSTFMMKNAAKEQLEGFEAVINEETKKYKPKVVGYKNQRVISPREQAIEALIKKDPIFKNYELVSQYIDDILTAPETLSNNEVVNFWRGFTSKHGYEYVPVVSGVFNTLNARKIKQIADIPQKERSAGDELLLQMFNMKQQTDGKVKDLSNSYNAGQLTADMLPFIGEMVITSPLAGIAKKGVQKAIMTKLAPNALRLGDKGFKFTMAVAPNTAKTIGYLAGAGARTAASPQRFIAGTYQNMTNEMSLALSDEFGTGFVTQVDKNSGDNFLPAFAKSFGSTFTEYVSEGLGEKIPGLGRYLNKNILGDPDWMKRLSIGRYLRKKGLNKSNATAHFLNERVGWNGVFGEVAEEIINQPLQNIINGQDIFEGMYDTDAEGNITGSDFLKELTISMGATGFVFSGGSLAYNAYTGKTNPTYFVDNKRFNDKVSAKAEIQKLHDQGKLNANTDIEVNNDFEAFDEFSNLTEEFGFKDIVKSVSGTKKAVNDKIAATEIEVKNAIENTGNTQKGSETIKELENIETRIQELKTQKEVIKQDNTLTDKVKQEELTKLTRRLESFDRRRKAIVDPIIKKIENKKKLKLYKDNVASVRKRSKSLFGISMPIIEVSTEAEARQQIQEDYDGQIEKAKGDTKKIAEIEKNREATLREFNNVQGFITPEEFGNQRIIINKSFSLSTGNINVANHEFFHRIIQSTLRQNPETAIAMGEALSSFLKQLDPRQYRNSEFRKRLINYQTSMASLKAGFEMSAIEDKNSPEYKEAEKKFKAQRISDAMVAGEEALTLFSDAIASGDLQFNETMFTKIGDIIKKVLTAMGIRADFNNARDVFNFVRDYNKTMLTGKPALSKDLLKRFRENKVTFGGELKQSIEQTKENIQAFAPGLQYNPQEMSFAYSKDNKVNEADVEKLAIDPETGERYTNDKWAKEGVNNAFMQLVYGDMMHGMIRNIGTRLEGNNVFNQPFEGDNGFFQAVKNELSTAILNFKPEDNNNFSGWIAFHIGIKKPGVLDTFKKRDQEKKPAPQPTESVIEKTGGIVVAKKFGLEENVDSAIDKQYNNLNVGKYKDVKQAIVSVEKIKDPKTGKMKSPTKVEDVVPTGPLYPVLQLYAKEFGINPKKILGNIALTKKERRKAQQALNKLGVRTALQLMPEGFTANFDATGMPTSILNAVNPDTGEPNLLYTKIGRKKNLDLQKKNNIDSINIAAASNVFGITPVGDMNRFDTENRLVDGPLRTIVTQLATLSAGQSIIKKAESEGNFNRFASIKDGKSDYAFSLASVNKLDLERRLEFMSKIDNLLGELKPGFGKELSKEQIVSKLDSNYGDLFSKKEKTSIATQLQILFDLYKPKTMALPDLIEQPWGELVADVKGDELQNVFGYLGIDQKYTQVFDNEVNINKMRQSISALGNNLLQQGLSLDKIAEIMVVLQPAYAGNTQISRKKNFTVIQDPSRPDYGHAYKISDSVSKTDMSSPRNQSFESVSDFETHGVMAIDGMTDAIWQKAKNKITLRRQDAKEALKGIDASGSSNLQTEIKADAELAREAIDYMMDFLIQSPNHDVIDAGMFLVSNLSHMEAPIRRAAMFTDVAEGLTDPNSPNYVAPENRNKSTVVYEHSIPASDMAYRVAYYKFENKWNNSFWDKYTVAVIPKKMDDVLKANGLQSRSNPGFNFTDPNSSQYDRYYGPINYGEQAIVPIKNIFTGEVTGESHVKMTELIKSNYYLSKSFDKARLNSRKIPTKTKGITILDFDDTLATTKSMIRFTKPDGTKGKLNAEQYARDYVELSDQGYKWDFSEFSKVVGGKTAPLFNKALKLAGKFGTKDMFVLTARPADSAVAIQKFLKANGLNIPLKNITGLGNSTSEAKALWVADKAADGYNDFYFADDALQNVQAVQNMLDQFDVKSKVQQAKVRFSKSIDSDFNKILEQVTGIEAFKRFDAVKARKRGSSKGKFRFFIPPSHEDFVGLLYNFIGKGRQGDQHRNFFEQHLIKPLNRGYRELDTARQAIANDYKALNKKFPDIKKKLKTKTPDGDFTYDDAVRIYLWNKHGHTIPGLSSIDQKNLSELIMNDKDLRVYADTINIISKQEQYVPPQQGWEGGNIKIDLIDATGRVGREQYFTEFNENAEIMFNEVNLNKIEAAYGKGVRSALEDMLYRIKTGINRPKGQSATVNAWMNYLNGSVGSVMFFNMRSAILQQMSIVNYINFADNNMFAAAKAFANQKQYWKDFAFIFNSDMLKQRRGGIGTDINGADLAQAVSKSKNPISTVIGELLKLGFLPTQIGDNIAIATGGATFYRNRINTYIKQGMPAKEAEAAAFTDFQDLTQSTQQSSRPDMTSQQQSMWIGKMVLNFQNITSQYNRLIKKAASDIYNRRISPPYTTQFQSDASNMSRILYYAAIQNVIFYSLQTALFAVMFGDEDESNEKFLDKKERVINGSIDSILRGSGIYGVAVSTLKNMAIKWFEQREKDYNKDESAVLMEALNFSPVIGIKARKLVNAEKTINFNESVISEMEVFDADNPAWSATTNYIEAFTNFPANRLYQKSINVRNSLDNDYEAWQRALFFSGYTTWSLGLGDTKKMIEVKETVKEKKKEARKEKAKIRREEKKKEQEQANKAVVEENKKKSKEDGRCSAINRKGQRCNNKVVDGKSFCTIHEKVEQNETGVKKQCTKIKSDGKRCKMMTSSKSGLCYYHD